MYLVTVLIVKAIQLKQQGKTLGSLIADLEEPVESTEIRLNITEEDFRKKGTEAIELVTSAARQNPEWHIAPDNGEGIRIQLDLDGKEESGWVLLRLSVHDPVLPVNCESDVPGGVQRMLRELYNSLADMSGIDLNPLKKAIED
jgi:phosphomannomutase